MLFWMVLLTAGCHCNQCICSVIADRNVRLADWSVQLAMRTGRLLQSSCHNSGKLKNTFPVIITQIFTSLCIACW